MPADISGKKIFIRTEVVECDLPLLLSKEAMKRANTSIDFSTDTVIILGSTQKLLFTSSGHYCVPLGHHIFAVEEDSSMLKSESVLFSEEFKQKSPVEKRKDYYCCSYKYENVYHT